MKPTEWILVFRGVGEAVLVAIGAALIFVPWFAGMIYLGNIFWGNFQ